MDYLENIIARNRQIARDADKFASRALANAREWERRAAEADTAARRKACLQLAARERKGANI